MTLRFITNTLNGFVGRSAEQYFQEQVAQFCVNFEPQHVKLAAESGKPFEELVTGAGFQIQPTPVDRLNPWDRHLVNLPDQRLLELVEGAVSPAHVVMLRQYPQVTEGLIRYVKTLAINQRQ